MKLAIFFVVTVFSSISFADEIVLLGNSENIAFDEVKARYISNTVKRLLENCTTKTEVETIPEVKYKGVRVNFSPGLIVEAHIFPNSKNTYMVEIYTADNGKNYLNGKYTDYAYQLIAMLETKI